MAMKPTKKKKNSNKINIKPLLMPKYFTINQPSDVVPFPDFFRSPGWCIASPQLFVGVVYAYTKSHCTLPGEFVRSRKRMRYKIYESCIQHISSVVERQEMSLTKFFFL